MGGRFRNRFAIGAAALAAAAFAGGAYAATQSGSSSRQAFLNDVAKRLNVSPAELKSALKGAMIDRIDEAVKDGRLTQAQADAMKKRIDQGGFPLGFGMHREFGHRFRHLELRVAANYLGLTDAQLLQRLRSGKSLAQVAKDKGKTTAGLEQAMTAPIRARLDKAVAAGRITKAQEQKLLNRLQTRLGRRINQAGLARTRPMPMGPMHDGGAPGSFGGPPPPPPAA